MNPNSEMDRLEPIPSPPGHLLREFCHRALPVVAFVAAGIGAASLWNERFTGTLLHGEVEPISADITTLEGGTIVDVHVQRWQPVTNGQIIATIQVVDPTAVGRSIDVLRTELHILRSRMALDAVRNAQDLEGLRVRWLEARVQLATARVNLGNAERELERNRGLHRAGIVSAADLDTAQSLRDALQVEIEERTKLAEGLEQAVTRLDADNQREQGDALDVVNQSLAAQERQLEGEGTHTLRAPMDGILKTIEAVRGERVPANAVVAVVTSPISERIIGYIRQPLSVEPKLGMPVEIRTRGGLRQIGQSQISDVGTGLELVASPLRLRGFDNAVERGLAFAIPIPPEMQVHPGELVDLIVRPASETP